MPSAVYAVKEWSELQPASWHAVIGCNYAANANKLFASCQMQGKAALLLPLQA